MGSSFPGEEYFQVDLPNFDLAHASVSLNLFFAFIFWVLFFPVLFSSEVTPSPGAQDNGVTTEATKGKTNGSGTSNGKGSGKSSGDSNGKSAPTTTKDAPREVPIWATGLSVLGWMGTSLLIVLFCSPYNNWLPRRVLVVPMLTREECDHIVQRAMAAAERNVLRAQKALADTTAEYSDHQNKTWHGLLDEPLGWQKYRHNAYPTTDLNLVTDPFTPEDREFIASLLDRRLAPLMARLFGITQASIRTNDMFVVRYDADKRAHLANHSDDGDISFNILLTDTFEGGGTKFWDQSTGEAFAHVEPTQPGQLVAHSAQLHHEGYHVSKGTRIILVGFTATDRVDPWENTWTGLTWLASFANMNWVTVKFKQSIHNSASRLTESMGNITRIDEYHYFRLLFREIFSYAKGAMDRYATHAVEHLVADENRDEFLKALEAGHERIEDESQRASWYKGQQITVNLDGTLNKEWGTRADNLESFEEL